MPEITRLSGNTDWIDLDFVERERTPEFAMKLGIQMHVAGLSLSNTVSILDYLGVQRSRKAVHDWVQKADLQPSGGKAPNQVAVDETVIRINDQQYWLYAAADPHTNDLLHLRLFSTTTTALTEIFFANYNRNTMSTTPDFSSMARPTSKLRFTKQDSDFKPHATEIETVSNVSSAG
jgi:putative transposase